MSQVQGQHDPNFDYTRQYDGETPFDDNPGDDIDYEIGEGAVASPHSADEIEQERAFKSIEPGEHELIVLGFLTKKDAEGPVTRKHKDCYIAGKRASYTVDSVTVKLGKVGDTSRQVLQTFELPPSDPAALRCYYEGTKAADSKPSTRGFNGNMFCHFVERLGFPYAKGKPLPPEARKLRNWIGRKVIATIIPGESYTDENGETKTYSNKVELFSYKPHPDTLAQYRRGGEVATTDAPKASTADKRPAPAKKTPVAAPAGLDNI